MFAKKEDENMMQESNELLSLCESVKKHKLSKEALYEQVVKAMMLNPHSALPHNLMGIIMEKSGDKQRAMAHYRAAYALDPTYLPARWNMERMVGLNKKELVAYSISDCPQLDYKKNKYKMEYDEKGIGHMIKRGERL
ncbi:MAG: hypothetical protein RR945_08940 [Erysipelotrichaceae bacterium]